ncbi:MAG: 4'-phosphopantetheinyl transferase family protein [Terrimicrobiaceae bacterium]
MSEGDLAFDLFQPVQASACFLHGGIHVWRFFSAPDDEIFLSPEEAARAVKYQSTAARAAYLAGRAGLRRAAALYSKVPPQELRISIDGNGKPFFENAGIHFNLSHSGSAIVGAFSEAPVGLDIESRGRCHDFVAIARRFFHPSEADSLAAAPDEEDFLRLWTGKEAMLKLSGEGLAGGLLEARPGERGIGTLGDREVHITRFSFENTVGSVASFQPAEVKGWFQF